MKLAFGVILKPNERELVERPDECCGYIWAGVWRMGGLKIYGKGMNETR